jgi:hypothetical protein
MPSETAEYPFLNMPSRDCPTSSAVLLMEAVPASTSPCCCVYAFQSASRDDAGLLLGAWPGSMALKKPPTESDVDAAAIQETLETPQRSN